MEKIISNLESTLSNERKKHKRSLKEVLEENEDLRKQVKSLQAIIFEKTKEIEAARNKVSELNKGIEDREKLFSEIEVEIEDIIKQVNGNIDSHEEESLPVDGNAQERDTSQVSEDSSSMPAQPVTIPVNKQLCFFATEEVNYDLDYLLGGDAEPLGKGTFGTTFKVALESGLTRVVKRLRNVNLLENEFHKLITKISELEHENIMPIKAYCFSNDEKLLVYDFMATGSLSTALHGSTNRDNPWTPLDWEARAKIALAVARGVAHIHSVGPKFAHGNIKSSNILLTTNSGARVSDHNIHSLASPITSRVGRTGYLAPEMIDPIVTSQKGDIYSFGVLILELLTGKAPAEVALYDGVNLVKWAQSELRDGWADAVLQNGLIKDQSVEGDELVQFLQLAIDCTAEYPEMRPRMNDVVIRVVEILEARFMAKAKGKNGKKPVNKPESVRSVRTRYLW